MVGGTPAFSTTKTGRHDIAESGVKTPTNQSINHREWKSYLPLRDCAAK